MSERMSEEEETPERCRRCGAEALDYGGIPHRLGCPSTDEDDPSPHACEENDPCAQALDDLWREIILKRSPSYGDWEYPAQAYRHLLAEFNQKDAEIEKLRAELDRLREAIDNAPHDKWCNRWTEEGLPCDCWKVRAALGEEK